MPDTLELELERMMDAEAALGLEIHDGFQELSYTQNGRELKDRARNTRKCTKIHENR